MAIQIRDVVKRFGARTVLDHVSLQVEDGQFVVLLGPSGCGKTTLLGAIAGLLDIDGGTIEQSGRTISRAGFTLTAEQRRMGMVFQDFALWPHMNVYDNVAFGLRMKRVSKGALRQRVRAVLETVRMEGYESYYPHQLSGGQKQRIAIARAIAPEPTVLLMDEPLSSLDAKLRQEMRWELHRIILEEHITTVYVTHDQIEALSMADRIVLLYQGKIEQQGTPKEIYGHPQTVFAAGFLGGSNLLQGRVEAVDQDAVSVNCSGVVLESETVAAPGDAVTLMIRPDGIDMADSGEHAATDAKSELEGIVHQRAFHGNVWQYRVEVKSAPRTSFEVWNPKEVEIGQTVWLRIPAERVKVLRRPG